MKSNIDLRVERTNEFEAGIVDSSRAINDVALIYIKDGYDNQVLFYLPYDQGYDGMRMTLGEFTDKINAAIESAFELREGAHQRREEAEEDRHEEQARDAEQTREED